MQDYFATAHKFTAVWEGSYSNNPADPGGETNLGVTRRVWMKWCQDNHLPVKLMRDLTMADVLPLYRAQYWSAVDDLPWPLSGVAYDIAVNHGPGNLKKMLAQVPAGAPEQRASQLIDVRESFYRGIVRARPSQGVFLNGWLNRVKAQRAWLAEQVTLMVVHPEQQGTPVRLFDPETNTQTGVGTFIPPDKVYIRK